MQLRFLGPMKKQNEAIEVLRPLGFTEISDSLPWRECFEEEELTPGAMLAGARGKEGLTQQQLAQMTGIPQRHISEMEHGKRPIGKETAKKLSKALNIGYKVFL